MSNSITIIGNLGKDPKVMQAKNSGEIYVTFSIASREGKDRTNWFFCKAFKRTAKTIQDYCAKGSKIAVFGKIDITENQDGTKFVTVLVGSIELLSSTQAPPQERSQLTPLPEHMPEKAPVEDFDDGIPF